MNDRQSTYLMSPALFWLTAFMVVPCLLILALAFFRRGIYGGVEYSLTLENIGLVFDPLYARIFLKSAMIAGAAASVSSVIGYACAYAIVTLPKRRQAIVLFLVVLPFWSNYLVRTYAWIVLLNREGIVVNLVRMLGYENELPQMLYTVPVVVIGLVYNYLPFVILACFASLSRMNPEVVEASRDLGAGPWVTFRRVILPMTFAGVATGFAFVFVLSIGNFITPALLGGGSFQMIGNLVYDQFLKANDWPFGAALSMILIAVMLGLLTLQAYATEKASGTSSRAQGGTQ